MNSKVFSQRFNRELALLDFPEELSEKIIAVAKVFDVKRHVANAMIFGHVFLSMDELTKVARILDVCPLWLAGSSNRKKAFSDKETA